MSTNYKHIGKDFIPHDVRAKVTGTAAAFD